MEPSERGLISPADFIPVAEETGLIVPLGEWVLKAACYEAIDWPDHLKVAVNLSPAQLNNRNLLNVVMAVASGNRHAGEKTAIGNHRNGSVAEYVCDFGDRCMSCASSASKLRWTTSERAIRR